MVNIKNHSQKITPCLWFDNNAEEAVNFYTSIFKNSKKEEIAYYGEGGPMPPGTILTIRFKIQGQNFLALNGGPDFKFTEAVSFIVNCETQEEIDYYWENLSKDGGAEIECGWLKDKFGLSWQIVPEIISELMSSEHPEKSTRVMQAILKMKKLDLKTLKQAYVG